MFNDVEQNMIRKNRYKNISHGTFRGEKYNN